MSNTAAFTFTDGTPVVGTIQNIVYGPGETAPAKPPTWVSSDTTTFNPTVAADGMSCTGTFQKTGTITVTTTADSIVFVTTLTVIAGTVVSFNVVFAPAPPPPPPPPAATKA